MCYQDCACHSTSSDVVIDSGGTIGILRSSSTAFAPPHSPCLPHRQASGLLLTKSENQGADANLQPQKEQMKTMQQLNQRWAVLLAAVSIVVVSKPTAALSSLGMVVKSECECCC
jgi:hypothetical protein